MVKVVLVVAVALFDQQGRVLLAQRPPGKAMAGLWEFPGGKIDAGETPEAALCRELNEELSIEVGPNRIQP
jgi:8-oxo-dGTP diphosphatase